MIALHSTKRYLSLDPLVSTCEEASNLIVAHALYPKNHVMLIDYYVYTYSIKMDPLLYKKISH